MDQVQSIKFQLITSGLYGRGLYGRVLYGWRSCVFGRRLNDYANMGCTPYGHGLNGCGIYANMGMGITIMFPYQYSPYAIHGFYRQYNYKFIKYLLSNFLLFPDLWSTLVLE